MVLLKHGYSGVLRFKYMRISWLDLIRTSGHHVWLTPFAIGSGFLFFLKKKKGGGDAFKRTSMPKNLGAETDWRQP